jgi:hypothetical protein
LSIDQLKIGDPKDVVIKEYDDKYESETNDQSREIWIFKSYQATFAIDPVQKLVTVEFMNDRVSDVSEKYLRGQNLMYRNKSVQMSDFVNLKRYIMRG